MATHINASEEAGLGMPANPPKENLVRALAEPPTLTRSVDAAMPTLTGHFAVTNQWTEINSMWEGNFMERIAPGAFKKTISENKDRMRVLFQHGNDPQVGDKVLGPITDLREDEVGAFYEVPMLDTQYNRELIPGLEAGLYGASFRFQVMKEELVDKPKQSKSNPRGLPERTVQEALVREFGPVTFPAYAGASAGLRSMTDQFIFSSLLDDPERLRALIAEEVAKQSRASFTIYPPGTSTTGTFVTLPFAKREDPEPDPSGDTTPDEPEPEPSGATTRTEPGTEPEPPVATTHVKRPRFNTREEWLQWIQKT